MAPFLFKGVSSSGVDAVLEEDHITSSAEDFSISTTNETLPRAPEHVADHAPAPPAESAEGADVDVDQPPYAFPEELCDRRNEFWRCPRVAGTPSSLPAEEFLGVPEIIGEPEPASSDDSAPSWDSWDEARARNWDASSQGHPYLGRSEERSRTLESVESGRAVRDHFPVRALYSLAKARKIFDFIDRMLLGGKVEKRSSTSRPSASSSSTAGASGEDEGLNVVENLQQCSVAKSVPQKSTSYENSNFCYTSDLVFSGGGWVGWGWSGGWGWRGGWGGEDGNSFSFEYTKS